jgi:hypothetical protein
MKNIVATISLTFLIAFEISCKKTDIQTNLLVGKWNIIEDSASITGSLNGFNSGSNFIGTSNDYYNFTANGNLYINEGLSLDTATYLMVTKTQVELVYYYDNGISFAPNGGVRGTFNITNLTAHTVTLTDSGLTPEGQELQIIRLKR